MAIKKNCNFSIYIRSFCFSRILKHLHSGRVLLRKNKVTLPSVCQFSAKKYEIIIKKYTFLSESLWILQVFMAFISAKLLPVSQLCFICALTISHWTRLVLPDQNRHPSTDTKHVSSWWEEEVWQSRAPVPALLPCALPWIDQVWVAHAFNMCTEKKDFHFIEKL